jgi:hypothetical protein
MVTIFIGINATVNNISAMMYNMAHSFIGVYVVPDTLLKVLLSTNKTGHHVLRYI